MKKWFLIIPLIAVVAAGGWIAYGLYAPFRGYRGKQILVISPGARAETVSAQLVQHGVLAYRLPFLVRYWLGKQHQETLKWGEYLFDRPLSASQVYEKLARGEVYLHTVVIPEGFDRFDMARTFAQDLGLSSQSFLSATQNTSAIRDLDPQARTLEGYLFPDTYRFPRGVAAARIVQTMVGRFRQVLHSGALPGLSGGGDRLHDVMTLASLVEKETPDPAERPLIAGVFTRRLSLGMPLQCDPTVIYAVRLSQEDNGAFLGPITGSDLKVPSPYNTYARPGLPPGPICSPGLASIRAALDPAPGKALYFVSNNHGGHVFSNTLEEQVRNVKRYRQQLREQNEKQLQLENR